MRLEHFIVYMHRNTINGKVYIGQTCYTLNNRSGKDGCGYRGKVKRCKGFLWEFAEEVS